MKTIKDKLGRVLKVGNTIAYATRNDWSAYLMIRKVTKINERTISFDSGGWTWQDIKFVIVSDIEQRKKPRVYVDMDDVLAMFTYSADEKRKVEPGIKWPQCEFDFFRKLPVMYFAREAMHKLQALGFDMWILTRPSVENPLCYTEKRVWVEERLGKEWCKKLILAPDKTLLKGDFLIDDNEWPGFEGEHIHFGSPEFPNWAIVVNYLLNHKIRE